MTRPLDSPVRGAPTLDPVTGNAGHTKPTSKRITLMTSNASAIAALPPIAAEHISARQASKPHTT